jgi:amidase
MAHDMKDSVCSESSLGMPTTGGSWGFVAERVKKSASVVENLVEAGMILLGKANLSVSLL